MRCLLDGGLCCVGDKESLRYGFSLCEIVVHHARRHHHKQCDLLGAAAKSVATKQRRLSGSACWQNAGVGVSSRRRRERLSTSARKELLLHSFLPTWRSSGPFIQHGAGYPHPHPRHCRNRLLDLCLGPLCVPEQAEQIHTWIHGTVRCMPQGPRKGPKIGNEARRDERRLQVYT